MVLVGRGSFAVWSTAQRKNLDPMIRLAFHGLPPPRLVFDQTNCTDTGQLHPGDTTGTHRVLIKELATLWRMHASTPVGMAPRTPCSSTTRHTRLWL